MRKRFLTALSLAALLSGGVAASGTVRTGQDHRQRAGAQASARTAPDNSEITVRHEDGVRIETRTFRDPASRVQRVEVRTAADGTRTTHVYLRDGSMQEVAERDDFDPLDATGDAIVTAAGFTVDAGRAVASATRTGVAEAADVAGDVAGATKDVAQTAVSATGDAAVAVGERTAAGAKVAAGATKTGVVKTADVAEDVGEAAVDLGKDAAGATKTGVAVAADKTEDVAGATVDATRSAARATRRGVVKTADVAEDVGSAAARGTAEGVRVAADKTEDVASGTADVAKKGGNAFVRGMKKIGNAFKSIFN
jgi:hypothetical protein